MSRRTFRPSRWALLLLLAAGLAVAADLFLPAGLFPPKENRVILVQRGQSLRAVADELQRVGLLRGTLGFMVLARVMHLDRSIRAGQYSFQLGSPVPVLLRALARGMSGLNLITIPEGLTTSEVSLLLSNHLGVPVAEFDSLAHDRAFLDSLGISAPSIEGYLSPDSYEFLPGTAPEVAFRTMAKRTLEMLLKAAAGRDSLPLGLSLHQVLTLASIVEAEAMVNSERPRIARVYLNRLAMGMRLQADPTVGYALGSGPRTRLSLRQLRVASPFNTYLYEGLPPGPICNPGRASIAGVIDPLPDVKDLYFVADGHGHHLFSQTYAQHLANIRRVRGPVEAGPADTLSAAAERQMTGAPPGPSAPGKAGATAKPAETKPAAEKSGAATKPGAGSKSGATQPAADKSGAAARPTTTTGTGTATKSATTTRTGTATKPAATRSRATKPDTTAKSPSRKSKSSAKPGATTKPAPTKPS